MFWVQTGKSCEVYYAVYDELAILAIILRFMNSQKKRKRIQLGIGIIISLACLLGVFYFVDPTEIYHSITQTKFEFWTITVVSLILFLSLRGIRWRFMLNSGFSASESVPFGIVFHIQNIGYLLTNLLPFRLGDVARAVLIGNVPPITISRGLSTMVAERVFDLLFFVILLPFVLPAVTDLPAQLDTVFILTGILAVIATLILIVAANLREQALRIAKAIFNHFSFVNSETWLRRIDDLLRGLTALTTFRSGIFLILLSVLVWIPVILGYYFGMVAVNLQPSLTQAILVVCIAALSVTAPSSPGQVGVFEASVTFAISGILGLPEAQAASFAFLYHAINYLVIGVLGVLGIVRTGETFGSVIASTRALVRPESKQS